MAPNETFCLRLNEFEDVRKSCWQELQKENDLCDITLGCEDRQIKTHKFVISAFKKYFEITSKSTSIDINQKSMYINLKNLIT